MPTFLFSRLAVLRVALCAVAALFASLSAARPLDHLTVLAVGEADRVAVVKSGAGPAATVAVGQTVPGTQALLAEVQADRILLLVPGAAGKGSERIWVFPARAGAPGRMERFATQIDAVPFRSTPATVSLPLGGGAGASSVAPRPR